MLSWSVLLRFLILLTDTYIRKQQACVVSIPKKSKLAPWSRDLIVKILFCGLVQKFRTSYGTRRFITVFRVTQHLSLSWAKLIQFSLPIIHNIHFNIILPTLRKSCKRCQSYRLPPNKTLHYCTYLCINLLKTKHNLVYIRNQSVPRSKHFPPRL